ncbi:MAG: hypothetical protein RLO51_00150 [Thalassobaculum sp.]|uniref:hypothetical protein n=2 Tax=Thalassobaculum sp. TaxID=2022740 RepID=UPI0032EEFF30
MAQSLYEVHTLKGGQWVIDSTYPDRESSIEVAKQLHGEKRFDGVKVIRDTFDPKTGDGKEIVVYDTSKAPREKSAAPPPAAAKAAEAAAAVAATGSAPSRPAGKPRKGRNQDVSVAVKAILWLTVILVGGLGVLYLVSKAGDLMGKGF